MFQLLPYSNGAYPAFAPPPNADFSPPQIVCITNVTADNNQNTRLYGVTDYNTYGIATILSYGTVGVTLLTLLTSLLTRTGLFIAL